MYQITEMSLSADAAAADDSTEPSVTEASIVPGMLTKVVQMLAQLCKHKKEQAQRVRCYIIKIYIHKKKYDFL